MKKLFSFLCVTTLLFISCVSCSSETNTTPTEYDPSLVAITILDGKVVLNLESYEYHEISHSEFCKDVINEAVKIYNEIAGSDVRIPDDKQIDYETLRFVGSRFEDLPQYLQSKAGEHQTYYKNYSEIVNLENNQYLEDLKYIEYCNNLFKDAYLGDGIPLDITRYSDKDINNELEIWLKAIGNVTDKYSERNDIDYPELMSCNLREKGPIALRASGSELYPTIREILKSVYRSQITPMLKFETLNMEGGVPFEIFGLDEVGSDIKDYHHVLQHREKMYEPINLNVNSENRTIEITGGYYYKGTSSTYTDNEYWYISSFGDLNPYHSEDDFYKGLIELSRGYSIEFYKLRYSDSITTERLSDFYNNNIDYYNIPYISLSFSDETNYYHIFRTLYYLWYAGYVDPTPLIECKYPPYPITESEESVEVMEEIEEIIEIPEVDEELIYEEPSIYEGRRVPTYIFTDIVKNSLTLEDYGTTPKEYITVEDNNGKKREEIFSAVEEIPKFPGDEAALMEYIKNNIQYPQSAIDNGVQGRVIVQFAIKKDGSIGEVKVVRSVDRDLDKEAVRIVKTLPKFTPGKMNGMPVNVWYTLPVTFKLPQN